MAQLRHGEIAGPSVHLHRPTSGSPRRPGADFPLPAPPAAALPHLAQELIVMTRTSRMLPLAALLFSACVAQSSDDASPPDGGQPQAPACAEPTGAPVEHTGEITGTEVWKADSLHVVRSHLNVRDGGKLVIEPCAVVRMAKDALINVAFPVTPNQGELVAEGTATQPIRFEPLDGARWGSINVVAPGKARLAYVSLEGGGGPETGLGETIAMRGDNALPVKANLFVDHVTVKGSLGPGLRVDGGAGFAPGSQELTVTGCGGDENPSALVLSEYALDSLPSGNYTGNRADQINIAPGVVDAKGGLQMDATIHDRGVPYVVGQTPGIDGLSIGWGSDDFAQPTLTIEAGVRMLFLKGSGLQIQGTEKGAAAIRALGTADKPVVFSSAAASPAPGDWKGFYFNGPPSADNLLEHVRIEYTGAQCGCIMVTCSASVTQYEGAILFSRAPTAAFLKDSVIAHGSGHGVVQGYDGAAFDWTTSNAFDDLAGCAQTLPRATDGSCPKPMPACQ
jgi:hypothetical protein